MSGLEIRWRMVSKTSGPDVWMVKVDHPLWVGAVIFQSSPDMFREFVRHLRAEGII